MLVDHRRLVVLLCLLVAAGCKTHPTGPTPTLDEQFVLTANETATIEGTPIRIRFVGVTGDSRCPADALCIQGGDAIVHIEVLTFGGGVQPYELHTGNSQPVKHDRFTIVLVELAPYPFSSRTIQPGEYRATLKVSS